MKKKFIATILGVALSGISCFAFAGCGHKHNYESVFQPATCTDRGYTLHECTDCGYKYADEFVEPYEHAYENCLSFAVPVEETQTLSEGYRAYSGLPEVKRIGQSLCEVAKEQQVLAQYTSEILKEFVQSASQSDSMHTIVFQTSECSFCGDGGIKVHTISVPILAPVPVPVVDLNNVKVESTMVLTPLESDLPSPPVAGHDHAFDFWTQLSNGASSPNTNSETVASVPTDYSVNEKGELTVDVRAGGNEAKMATNAQLSKIRQMTMADTIEEIEANAFDDFTDLRRVELPFKLKKIGANAFGAAKLDFVVIPQTLKDIGANAFGDCKQMKGVFYFGTEDDWDRIAFGSANDQLKTVPLYLYSTQKPTTAGNFWHFVDGEPVSW